MKNVNFNEIFGYVKKYLNNFRKFIFINSQYCNYYIKNNFTVLAGIMRNYGYRTERVLTGDEINIIDKKYRLFNGIMNLVVMIEIILYLYLLFFPYYLKLMEMPFFFFVITLSTIPLVALYLTYISVNYFYEKYLLQTLGTLQKTEFKPEIKEIEETQFEKYLKTPKYSVYVLLLIIMVFGAYIFTPMIVDKCLKYKKYSTALKLSNVYLKLIPTASDTYSQRAFAKFNLNKYESAVKDFEKANEYSFSNVFKYNILGTKIYYLNKDDMLKEFDNAINNETQQTVKYLLIGEKGTYLMKQNDYSSALKEFQILINAFDKNEDILFPLEKLYYLSSVAKQKTGDIQGAILDRNISKKMCRTCEFDTNTTLIQKH